MKKNEDFIKKNKKKHQSLSLELPTKMAKNYKKIDKSANIKKIEKKKEQTH